MHRRAARTLADPAWRAVLLLTALAAALRFSTLAVQGYWPDEAISAGLVGLGYGQMLEAIADVESTPPLYYSLAWAWAKLFGQEEFALRALSAAFGTATVPVGFLAARRFVAERGALFVAALVATSPALVWYSQEARSYALLVLLAAATLLFFGQALTSGRRRALALWALVSALALATHYFAAFLIVPEALVLLTMLGRRRDLLASLAAVAAAAIALLPLALHQSRQGNTDWLEGAPLGPRIVDVAQLFTIGNDAPGAHAMHELALGALAAFLAGALALFWLRTGVAERRGVRVPALLAAAAIAVPIALTIGGLDYVIARNFLPALIPLAICIAAGVAASRAPHAGAAIGVGIVAISLALTLAVPLDRSLQREAMTARIAGSQLDGQRLAVRADLTPAGPGGQARGTALCPSGYLAASGGGSWISGELRDVPVSGKALDDRGGWTASGSTPDQRDSTLMVLVFCVSS